MKLKKTKTALQLTFIIAILLLLYLPILSMVVFSFNSARSVTRLSGFSFKWYGEVFIDTDFRNAMINTFIIAIISTIISTVIGLFGALGLVKLKPRTKQIILGINEVPMISPDIITAISLFVIFGALHVPSGYISLILSHITFQVPFVIVAIYPKVLTLDANLANAAQDLGATPTKSIFKVIIPQLKGAILAGAAIAFAMSFDDFVISYFAAGDSGVQNISIYLYTLKRDVKPTINAFSTLILLVLIGKIIYDVSMWPRKMRKEKKRGLVYE